MDTRSKLLYGNKVTIRMRGPKDPGGSPDHQRRIKVLTALMAAAIVVSVVHYLDNYLNYASFPTADGVPAPGRSLVGLSWFAFTAAGVAGYAVFRSGRRIALACALLAYYSVSGLIGVGHYTAGEMVDAAWWRQGHVLADILCGAAIAAFAYSSWRRLQVGTPLEQEPASISARAAAGPPRPGS